MKRRNSTHILCQRHYRRGPSTPFQEVKDSSPLATLFDKGLTARAIFGTHGMMTLRQNVEVNQHRSFFGFLCSVTAVKLLIQEMGATS